jgi:hypothetical protein
VHCSVVGLASFPTRPAFSSPLDEKLPHTFKFPIKVQISSYFTLDSLLRTEAMTV